jgi:hypothetical protein
LCSSKIVLTQSVEYKVISQSCYYVKISNVLIQLCFVPQLHHLCGFSFFIKTSKFYDLKYHDNYLITFIFYAVARYKYKTSLLYFMRIAYIYKKVKVLFIIVSTLLKVPAISDLWDTFCLHTMYLPTPTSMPGVRRIEIGNHSF